MSKLKKENKIVIKNDYSTLITDINKLLESGRSFASRSVNALLTVTYWAIGREIVEYEQNGSDRADYGKNLLPRLSSDLSAKLGKGFSVDNLESMRLFYLAYNKVSISETLSRKSHSQISETPLRNFDLNSLIDSFPLSWSHYVMLSRRVKDLESRKFYESESIRGGWSVRQLDRQISSQFYERTLLSKNKYSMLKKAEKPLKQEILSPEEEIKDPYILEFLGLKDEYSESDLEEELINHLEKFLLELGGDFAFIGRQKRMRIGNVWFRVDLIFFHRKLKCLIIIDLKVGKFSHADAGQMHLYLNYAKEHWTNKDENPPVGLILCAEKDSAIAKYSLEGLQNKILAAEYKLALPAEKLLQEELKKTQKLIYERKKSS